MRIYTRSRKQLIEHKRTIVAAVARSRTPGMRLRHRLNGKTYQMGVKHGLSGFWMLCEQDGKKGVVDARIILDDFDPIQEAA